MGKSKKMLLKILAIVAAFAMIIAFVGAFAACGGDDSGSDDSNKKSSDTGSDSSSSTVYTVDGISNLSTSDYEFIHFSEYGDDHGVGMVNINDWGSKKLKANSRGSVGGTGATWGIELDVSNSATYALSVYCDMVGAGDVYDGECRMTYLFNGLYTASGNEYTLSEPTYVSVTFQTDTYWNYYLPSTGYDFADYLPGCTDEYQADENGVFFIADSSGVVWASLTSPNGVPNSDFRFTPEYLCTTVFGGATFVVDDSDMSITAVKDAVAPSEVGYI